MAKKNRKRTSEGFIFPALLAVILAGTTFVALSYLWFCGRCEAIGAQIKDLEVQKSELHKRVINEEFKWSNMKSPRNIENLIREMKLEMAWPEEKQIVRVRGCAAQAAPDRAALAENQYVQGAGFTAND